MANLKVTENPVAFMPFTEHVDPSNPAAGGQRLFVDTDHLLKMVDSSGTVTTFTSSGAIANPLATDSLWDAAGDLVQGTGANTAAKLGAGTAGQFLMSGGAATANAWASREADYVAITSPVSVTATTEGTANTCITGTSKTYENVAYIIDVFTPNLRPDGGAIGRNINIVLLDGSTVLAGSLGVAQNVAAQTLAYPYHGSFRHTPTAGTHQYIVKAFVSAGTGTFGAGAGGTGAYAPAFIRVTRAT